MDWPTFTHTLNAYNVDLFTIGKSEITVFTLVKLTISALVLWLVAGRFSRWTLNRLLGVREVGTRRTTVVTPDQIAILVPNQSFITSNVTNTSYLRHTVRLRVPVPIAPGQDVRRAETLLLEAAQQAELLADPKPEVAIVSLAASAVVLELWAWYDGKKFARSEILSKAYFAIVDTLGRNEVKLAG